MFAWRPGDEETKAKVKKAAASSRYRAPPARNSLADLVQCAEDALGVGGVGLQGLGFPDGDGRLSELLQPRPHEPGEDEGSRRLGSARPATRVVVLYFYFGKLKEEKKYSLV